LDFLESLTPDFAVKKDCGSQRFHLRGKKWVYALFVKIYHKIPAIFTALVLFLVFAIDYVWWYLYLSEFIKDYFWVILPFYALLTFIQVKILKWVYEVATRNKRSPKGFVWLAVFFPLIAIIILLSIDKGQEPASSRA
jgi:hypothetical protein